MPESVTLTPQTAELLRQAAEEVVEQWPCDAQERLHNAIEEVHGSRDGDGLS